MNSVSDNRPIVTLEQILGRHICPYCQHSYAQKSTLNRHLRENSCRALTPLVSKKDILEEVVILKKQNQELSDQIQKQCLSKLIVSDVPVTWSRPLHNEQHQRWTEIKFTFLSSCLQSLYLRYFEFDI